MADFLLFFVSEPYTMIYTMVNSLFDNIVLDSIYMMADNQLGHLININGLNQ